jgi:transposase
MAMMGRKARAFAPIGRLTLEELVPADHFYRQLDRVLDLGFVRELVAPYYAAGGRPSVDPVVFFKLQLVLFFEGLRSERQLLRLAADRLSVRWYIGYDLHEPLPDHSSLTRARERYGLEVFRRFFDEIVARCAAAGLVRGEDLYIDATKMRADASVESVVPRFAVAARAHVDDLFAVDEGAEGPQPPVAAAEEPARIGPSEQEDPGLAAANASRHDWLARGGRQERDRHFRDYVRTADHSVSATDPDATHLPCRDGVRLGYQGHYLVDGGKARIILGALATPGEVPEERPALDLIWRARARWGLRVRQATGDSAYGTVAIIRALEEQGVRAYLVLPDYDHMTPFFGKDAFRYDPAADAHICPGGAALPFWRLDRAQHLRVYRADPAVCAACALRARCTASQQGRTVSRHYDEEFRDRVRAYRETEAYHKARRKRSVWVEPLFAEAKDWHGLRRCRLRRLWRVNVQVLWTASGQNLKRLLARRGWGRRPFPAAPGLHLDARSASPAAC